MESKQSQSQPPIPDKVVSYCRKKGLDTSTIRWSTTRWLVNDAKGEVYIINPVEIQ